MSEIVTFYTNPRSRGRIVHWMLEDLRAPYELTVLRFDRGEHKKSDFVVLNPMGKLPAIVHRGTVVTESPAICAYLADAFPDAGLAPAVQDPKRGTYFRWLFFGAGCIDPAITDHAVKRAPHDQPGRLGWGTYDDVIRTLETAVTPGPWILGDQFSAADVYIGSLIAFGFMTEAIERNAAFQSFVGRCMERPAYQRATQQSDALSRELDK